MDGWDFVKGVTIAKLYIIFIYVCVFLCILYSNNKEDIYIYR